MKTIRTLILILAVATFAYYGGIQVGKIAHKCPIYSHITFAQVLRDEAGYVGNDNLGPDYQKAWERWYGNEYSATCMTESGKP